MTLELMDEGWTRHIDDTFATSIGEVWQRTRDGGIEIALQTDDRHRNIGGNVHGGVIMTILDRTVGVNCRALLEQGARLGTATLTVNFLRPVKAGDLFRTTCRVRKQGRKSYFVDAEGWVGDKLTATATGILMRMS